MGGVAGGTYLFALPGSTGAVKDGWDDILVNQLDNRFRPCNLVELMPRLQEHLRQAAESALPHRSDSRPYFLPQQLQRPHHVLMRHQRARNSVRRVFHRSRVAPQLGQYLLLTVSGEPITTFSRIAAS